MKHHTQHNTLLISKQIIKYNVLHGTSMPIGLFDSGVGGLSVYMHLKEVLPNERYVYYADMLNVPYGSRTSDDITELTLTAVDWLVNIGCKLVVIACNSASAHALDVARIQYPNTPIVGLVPALKPAVLHSTSQNVAVLATQATLNGTLLNNVISEYAMPAQVNVIKCFNPNLVPWVESGMGVNSDTAKQLSRQLHEFSEQKVDHLVLGCTHYPFFRCFVESKVTSHNLGIQVVDSGAAIASRVKQLLNKNQLNTSYDNNNVADVVNHPTSELHIAVLKNNHTIKIKNLIPTTARLTFFTTDTSADLNKTSKIVRRLIGVSA